MSLLRKKLLKETLWAILSKIIAFVCFYSLQIYLIRTMSVEKWGEWSVFWSMLVILLMTCDMGINISSKKFISEFKDKPEFHSVLRQAFFLRFTTSILLATSFWVVSERIFITLNKYELSYLFKFVPPLIFLFSMVEFYKTTFEAYHRLKYNCILSFAEHGSKLLILVVLFYFWKTLEVLAVGLNLAYTIAFIVGLLILWKKIYKLPGEGKTKKIIFDICAYSVPIFFMLFCGFLSLEIDTLMINYLQGNYETGIYSAAKQLIYYLPHISLAISMGTVPSLSKIDNDALQEPWQKFRRVLLVNAFIIVGVLFILGVSSGVLLPAIYGEAYEASVGPFLCLLPFGFFLSHGLLTGTFLDYRGRAGRRAINLSFSLVANIILNYLMISLWGAIGAAIATSLSYSAYCLFNHVAVCREFRA